MIPILTTLRRCLIGRVEVGRDRRDIIQMRHQSHHLGYAGREPKPKGNRELLEQKLTEGLDPRSSVHWTGERRYEAAVSRMPRVAARGWGKVTVWFLVTKHSF